MMKLISLIALFYLLTELLSRSSEKKINEKEIDRIPGPIELFKSFVNIYSKNDVNTHSIATPILIEDRGHSDSKENQVENSVYQTYESSEFKEVKPISNQEAIDKIERKISETTFNPDISKEMVSSNSFIEQNNSIRVDAYFDEDDHNTKNQINTDSAAVSTFDIKEWTQKNQKKTKK